MRDKILKNLAEARDELLPLIIDRGTKIEIILAFKDLMRFVRKDISDATNK